MQPFHHVIKTHRKWNTRRRGSQRKQDLFINNPKKLKARLFCSLQIGFSSFSALTRSLSCFQKQHSTLCELKSHSLHPRKARFRINGALESHISNRVSPSADRLWPFHSAAHWIWNRSSLRRIVMKQHETINYDEKLSLQMTLEKLLPIELHIKLIKWLHIFSLPPSPIPWKMFYKWNGWRKWCVTPNYESE